MDVLNLPEGLRFDDQHGILVEGIIARQLAHHPVGPRPNKSGNSCTFNRLSGNTTLSMFLVEMEPGTHKCAHRHLDETLTFVVSGQGWSEFRQDDSSPLTRFEWQAGDLYATPMNAWHEHVSSESDTRARLFSFKNTPLIQRFVGSGDGVDSSGWRLRDRYDDEPEYFTKTHTYPDGSMSAGCVPQLAEQALGEEDPVLGWRVASQRYVMGGHRMLETTALRIRPGGFMAPSRPVAEEAIVVLKGRGRTEIWSDEHTGQAVTWQAGDLVSPPLDVWRQHTNTGDSDVRLLRVRNNFVPLGLAPGSAGLSDARLPDRFPATVEARSWPTT